MQMSLVVSFFLFAVAGCESGGSRTSSAAGGGAAVGAEGGWTATGGTGGQVMGSGGSSVQIATGGIPGAAGAGGAEDPNSVLGTGGTVTGGVINVAAGRTGSGGENAPIAGASTGFTRTGNMVAARTKHTATLLTNGKVLVAGGSTTSPTNPTATASAELYDPATGIFSATGSMAIPRLGHAATLLVNGTVLVSGSANGAEIYDPTTGTFSATGNMNTPRKDHTATLLDNGKVLIAGGYADTNGLSSAELYDPETRTFTLTGNLTEARYQHAATLLANKRVLLVGGYVPPKDTGNNDGLTSAEVYEPASGTFAATGSMQARRVMPTATLLANGTVVVSGGPHGFEGYFASASLEVYDPTSGTFLATSAMKEARTAHTATLLRSGELFFTGGYQGGGAYWKFLASTDHYMPTSGACAAGSSMAKEREYHTATLLADGSVLIVGGDSLFTPIASAEVYRQ